MKMNWIEKCKKLIMICICKVYRISKEIRSLNKFLQIILFDLFHLANDARLSKIIE